MYLYETVLHSQHYQMSSLIWAKCLIYLNVNISHFNHDRDLKNSLCLFCFFADQNTFIKVFDVFISVINTSLDFSLSSNILCYFYAITFYTSYENTWALSRPLTIWTICEKKKVYLPIPTRLAIIILEISYPKHGVLDKMFFGLEIINMSEAEEIWKC